MELAKYLDRIKYTGPIQADLECLRALHTHHLLNISYENLDVQLQRPVGLDLEGIYDKLVNQQRGGWCFEMNGLFHWALSEIGFEVMRMNAGVMRDERGDEAIGNHLFLCVNLDKPYLADVGLGNGMVEPMLLEEGSIQQRDFTLRLELLEDNFWRFHNKENSMPPTFDFRFEAADEDLFVRKCNELQTHPESVFTQNLVCQRLTQDGLLILLGRVFTTIQNGESKNVLLNSAKELQQTILTAFNLDVPGVESLWPQVCERHKVVFGDEK